MKKLSIAIVCSLICNALQAQNVQGYWYSSEGEDYYQLIHALPQSSAAFYSQHGGGRMVHTQYADANGNLCYKAGQMKTAALVLNKSATGNYLLHFREKEFSMEHIRAEQHQANKILRWEAAVSNLSSYEMVVLKSTVNGVFKEVAVIEPYSTELTAYSWSDEHASVPCSYQLQIRNKQSDFSYISRIIHTGNDVALIYPTMVSDRVHIDMNIISDLASYKICNLQGQIVQQNVLYAAQNTIFINELAAGIYLMNIYTEQGMTTQKLIKE